MFGTLDELREERKRLDAQEAAWLRKVAAYDRSDDWRADGYANAANALRHACRMDAGVARGHVVLARKLEDLPEVADAFASGEISRSHAQVIALAYTSERAPQMSEIEGAFVTVARAAEPRELRNVVQHVTGAIDGDGGAADDDAKYARRQWYQSRTLDGMLKIDALLDPEHAEYWEKAVSAEMERDHLAADTRLPAQRRADAATNLIRQSLDHGQIGRPCAPTSRSSTTPATSPAPPRTSSPRSSTNATVTAASPPRPSNDSCATATSPASSPTAAARSSTSAAPPAPPPPHNGKPSWCATGTAKHPAATNPPIGARPTTSDNGPTAAPPTSTICSFFVGTTTAKPTCTTPKPAPRSEEASRQLPLPNGVGQVRHPWGGFRADRLQGHAARVHALEQADSGAEQHG